jgi:membrane-bound lytic murein transglycosylase B
MSPVFPDALPTLTMGTQVKTFSMAMLLLLSACGTQPSNRPDHPASAASAPAASASNVDTGTESGAFAKPVPNIELPAIRSLNGNPEPDSYAYREDARQLAAELAQNMALDPIWVWEALSKAKVKDNAARLMMPAPVPTAKNWAVYRSRFVEPIRIRAGVNFWHIYAGDLKRAENQYGVPAAIIAGVLGVETIYGKNTGNFRVLDVLTTLTLDFPKGRSDRSAFFKDELGEFLKLCQEQGTAPESMLGSYAGAVGMPQFMPSSIRRYAVDFDGDGHIDLMRSPVDAIGSVAHYLAEHGWQTSVPAYYDIAPPRDISALAKLLAPDILPSFSAKEMQELGARLPPVAQTHPGQLALVQLFNGQDAPTMIAGTANFYAITRYNQSSYYALAVIQLGDAVSREATRQNGQNP